MTAVECICRTYNLRYLLARMKYLIFSFLQSAALSTATQAQHTMPQEFRGKWETATG